MYLWFTWFYVAQQVEQALDALEAPLVAGKFGLNKGLIKEVRRYESFTVTVSTPPCTPFMIAFSLSHTTT